MESLRITVQQCLRMRLCRHRALSGDPATTNSTINQENQVPQRPESALAHNLQHPPQQTAPYKQQQLTPIVTTCRTS